MPRHLRLSAVVTLIAFATLLPFVAPKTHSHALVSSATAANRVLTYSTFLCGVGDDAANAIAVDASGGAYVAGETSSLNFPATAGARQTQPAGAQDAFVTKLKP